MTEYFRLHTINTAPENARPTFQVAVSLGSHALTKDGERLITSLCVTEPEVDRSINSLIEDLNKIKSKMKGKLKENVK